MPPGMPMDHEHRHRGDWKSRMSQISLREWSEGSIALLAGLGLLLIAFTGYALAHEGAKGVVKERMDLMKGQAKQMKLIGDMAKGKKKFDAAKAAAAAHDLGATTKKIPELFPEGSNKPPERGARRSVEGMGPLQGRCARRGSRSQCARIGASSLRPGLEGSVPEDDRRLQSLPRDLPRQGGGEQSSLALFSGTTEWPCA